MILDAVVFLIVAAIAVLAWSLKWPPRSVLVVGLALLAAAVLATAVRFGALASALTFAAFIAFCLDLTSRLADAASAFARGPMRVVFIFLLCALVVAALGGKFRIEALLADVTAALVAGALVLGNLHTQKNNVEHCRSMPGAREIWLVLGFAVLLAAAMTWRLLLAHGWIGMRQDWTATPFAGQFASWAAGERAGWLQLGLGERSIYPFDWLLLTVLQPIAAVLPAPVLSKVWLFGVLASSFFGYYWCARASLFLRSPSALGAALFAVLNPVIFNKAASGQLAYMWAYALLPFWFALYRRTRATGRWEWGLLAGLVAALMSSQLQFIAIIGVIVILDALFLQRESRGSRWPAPLLTGGVILIAQSGTLDTLFLEVGALLNSVGTVGTISWLSANSAPLRQTLALGGYVVKYRADSWRYIGIAPGIARTIAAAWIVMMALIAVGARRKALVRFSGITWLVGAFLSGGVDVPGGRLIRFAYLHVVALQVFREIYHWAAISAFGATILVAIGIEHCLLRPKLGRIFAAALVFLSVVNMAPALSGNWGGQIQTVELPPSVTEEYAKLAAAHRFERILWLPGDQPMQARGSPFAGTDPMAFSTPFAFWQYVPVPPLSQILAALRAGAPAGLNHLLRYSGVSDIVLRNSIRSRVPDFAYRRYPVFKKTYGRGANIAGVLKLHWRRETKTSTVAAFHAPYRAGIVALASGSALVSPGISVLQYVPYGLSPVTRALHVPIAEAALEGGDIATTEAMTIRRARDLLATEHVLESGNAATAWAPISGWWYYRYDFDEALDTRLVTFAPGARIRLGSVPAGDVIILSYVAAPRGGVLALRLPGGVTRTIRTKDCCVPALRAKAFVSPATGAVVVVNQRGEEALRHVYAVAPSAWRGAVRRIAFTLKNVKSVVLRVVGLENIPILRAGQYRTTGILTIDGHRVGPAIFLSPGLYRVRARPSGGALERGRLLQPYPGSPSDVRASADGLVIQGVIPPHARAIRLRMSFSRAWHLRLNGGGVIHHGVGDIFGNLWTFRESKESRPFQITNTLALDILKLHWASLLVLVGILLVAVLRLVRRN
ncbi:MAG: hypothetical protein ACYDFS_02540 [Vulcanimicrobiaceae bacterium]